MISFSRLKTGHAILLALGLWMGFQSTLLAHPFHLCVGQMKWSSENQVWEVSLRLHPQDLETAMTADLLAANRSSKVSIDESNFAELALPYFEKCFFLRRTPSAMNRNELASILKQDAQESERKESEHKVSEHKESADRSSLKWIGMEQERGWLWIHLEMSQPKLESGRQKLWISNALLLSTVNKQENTMSIQPDQRPKVSMQFRLGTEIQEMK